MGQCRSFSSPHMTCKENSRISSFVFVFVFLISLEKRKNTVSEFYVHVSFFPSHILALSRSSFTTWRNTQLVEQIVGRTGAISKQLLSAGKKSSTQISRVHYSVSFFLQNRRVVLSRLGDEFQLELTCCFSALELKKFFLSIGIS